MVTWDNYEEYIIMHADGELSPEEETALQAFIALHPELKSELDAYSAVKLTPDTTVVFANKESLLKNAPAGRIIAFPQWRKYSVAAGVALLLGLSVYKWNATPSVTETVAKNDTAHQINNTLPTPKQDNITNATNPKVENAVTTNDIKPQPAITKQHNNTTTATQRATAHNVVKQHNTTIAPSHQNTAVARLAEQVDKLPVEENKMMAVSAEPTQQNTATLAYTAVVAEEPAKQQKSFLDQLPIDELKKQGIESMAAAVANTYQHINNLKHNLSEKTLTIQVEKRKLILSF